jgi:hypothetical protein
MQKKANGILMAGAIKSEWDEASKEHRNPETSKVIDIFKRSMHPRLTDAEVVQLFEYVFSEYL